MALTRADREASKARAATAFLVDLFRVADPRGPLGGQVTLREVLAIGAERATRDLAGESLVQATLMGAIGRVYIDLGDIRATSPLLEGALELRRQHLDESHPELRTSLDHLGMLRREQRDPEAETLIRRALELRQRHLGAADPRLAESLTNFGRLLFEQGRREEAETVFREALLVREQAFEQPHAKIAESQSNLASALLAQGRPAPAIELYERALEIYERTLGDEHPDLAVSLQNLALARYAAGDARQASPLLSPCPHPATRAARQPPPRRAGGNLECRRQALEHGDLWSTLASWRTKPSATARSSPATVRWRPATGGCWRGSSKRPATSRVPSGSCGSPLPSAAAPSRAIRRGSRRPWSASAPCSPPTAAPRPPRPICAQRCTCAASTTRRATAGIALAESVLADCLVALERWPEAERYLRSSLPVVRRTYPLPHRLRLRAEQRLDRYCAARNPADRIKLCREYVRGRQRRRRAQRRRAQA